MLIHNLITAWRQFRRQAMASLINLLGLAMGIAASLLIFLYIYTEFQADTHWPGAQRMYRVVETFYLENQTDPFALSSFGLGPELQRRSPEVEAMTRLFPLGEVSLWVGDQYQEVRQAYMVDSSFLDLFPQHFLAGTPASALQQPNSLILEEATARRLFGSSNPIGRQVRSEKRSYTVTGVFRKASRESHLRFTALFSLNSLPLDMRQNLTNEWVQMNSLTYIRLKEGMGREQLAPRLNGIVQEILHPRMQQDQFNGKAEISVQAVPSIRFDNSRIYEQGHITQPIYLYILGITGGFLLLIACINYMNMSVVSSLRRAREVAIRKVAGARRRQLVALFLSESLMMALLAWMLALAVCELLMPGFNQLADKNLHFRLLFTRELGPAFVLCSVVLVLMVGLVGGGYPALVVSRYAPQHALRGGLQTLGSMHLSSAVLRKILVTVQLMLALVLMASSFIVFAQLRYMKTRPLGFAKDQVVVVDYTPSDTVLAQKVDAFCDQLLRHPGVKAVGATSHLPGASTARIIYGFPRHSPVKEKAVNTVFVDYQFQQALGLNMVQGRWFGRDHPHDAKGSIVVNQAFMKMMGWTDIHDKTLFWDQPEPVKIIGVVNDFNYTSLHRSVEPLALLLPPRGGRPQHLLLHWQGDENGYKPLLESLWPKFDNKRPLRHYALSDVFDEQYSKEDKLVKVMGLFTLVTVVLSCVGLLGLMAYAVRQRAREISIRRILGASKAQLVWLLLSYFFLMLAIAWLMGLSFTAYAAQSWLHTFAYRMPLSWHYFVLPAGLSLLLTLLSVGGLALRAASVSPAKALRYE